MAKRQKINSISLRQNFPSYYQDLFSSCQIVVSTSDSLFWAGEYARFFGGLTILQKLPTKNLVGLEIINEPKICFAEKLYGFVPSRNSFEHVPFDPAKDERLLAFLQRYWPKLDIEGKIKGFKIHILSESHCGGGLGTTGVYLSCLAAGMYLLAGKVTLEEINKWQICSTAELINSPKHINFRNIFRLAWRLTAVCRDGYSSGATSFAAMLHSPYPIFYFSKNMAKYINPASISLRNDLANCEIIESVPFWGGKMEEIFPLLMPQPWPIDIGRIFSGTLINTETIFKMLSKLISDIDKLQNNINKELAPKTQVGHLDINSLFDFSQERNEYCSYLDFLDIFNILSIKMAFALKELFIAGPNEESLRQFISSIHQFQDFNHFLGHSTPLLDEICRRFTTIIAKENEFNLAGAKIEGIGKGGHILFIGPTGTMSDRMTTKAENLAKELGQDIYLDWASWIDGFGESGITVEQFIQAKKYSEFISDQANRLTTFIKGTQETKIIEPNKVETMIKDFDLSLVIPHHRLFIKGIHLSSKEIPSAKSTIEILLKILDHPRHKISNKLFADSSYGQSRYDLQSKIFIPLNKALQKYAKRKLDFQISGGMYDDYTVTLNPNNIKIALIESIE